MQYASDGINFLLVSRGPDGKLDLDPLEQFLSFDPGSPDQRVFARTYDPTNGVRSPGDIWRASEPLPPGHHDQTNGVVLGNAAWWPRE